MKLESHLKRNPMHLGSDRFLSESSRKSFRLDSVPIQEKISWTAIHPKIGKAVCSQSTWYPFSLQKNRWRMQTKVWRPGFYTSTVSVLKTTFFRKPLIIRNHVVFFSVDLVRLRYLLREDHSQLNENEFLKYSIRPHDFDRSSPWNQSLVEWLSQWRREEWLFLLTT